MLYNFDLSTVVDKTDPKIQEPLRVQFFLDMCIFLLVAFCRVFDCFAECLNYDITKTHCAISVSIGRNVESVVARTLNKMLFTLKLVRRKLNERNRPDILIKRREYAEWFLTMPFCGTVCLSMNAGTTFGPPVVMGERD